MFAGVLASLIAGVCMPAMFILFGDVTDAFVYNDLLTSINNETNFSAIVAANPDMENATIDE